MRVKVKAFGCKLNQAEAGAIERALSAAGHEIVGKPPYDAVIVCGCTVTVRADYKVRQYFRRISRDHGVERLILSGCSAVSFDDETVEKLGIAKTFARNDPKAIVKYFGTVGSGRNGLHTFAGRTRGYVKIQDGCDQFCAYCIVPHVRGRERSVAPEQVIDRVRELENAGVKEAVLTGVHDGRYSSEGLDLAGLCRRILDETSIPRIRLSSVEALEVSGYLIELMSNEARIAPHLHVPLQSGSDTVLSRMNRRYNAARYASVIKDLAREVADIGIGADVMVGFPGETEGEFRETFKLIESLPISYLHIFRYSPRPGTEAAGMADQIHNETKRERMEALRGLHGKLRERFAHSQFGKTRKVIIEKIQAGIGYGWTGNYLRAQFPINSNSKGKMALLKPKSYKNGVIDCKIIDIA